MPHVMGFAPQSVNASACVFRQPNTCRHNTRTHPLLDAHNLPTVIRNLDAWVLFRCTPHGPALFNPRDGGPADTTQAEPAYRGFHHLRDMLRCGEFCGCGLLLTHDCDAYPHDGFLQFIDPTFFLMMLEAKDKARAEHWRARGRLH